MQLIIPVFSGIQGCPEKETVGRLDPHSDCVSGSNAALPSGNIAPV